MFKVPLAYKAQLAYKVQLALVLLVPLELALLAQQGPQELKAQRVRVLTVPREPLALAALVPRAQQAQQAQELRAQLASALRALLAPLDRSTSDEAVERAESGLHSGTLSYDLIDKSEWKDHPWLSEIVQNSDIDCDRYFCLYGLSNSAAGQFRDVTLEFERADGTWDSVRPQLPGPHMPARYYEQPSVAWYDANQWGPGSGRPDSPTGRYRARIPTGWTGPPK